LVSYLVVLLKAGAIKCSQCHLF